MRLVSRFALMSLLCVPLALSCNRADATTAKPVAGSLHDFQAKGIDGKPRPLSEFKGKVVLVVNVASKCGYTPQYEGLQKLHDAYAAKGFTVVGFPSNDFFGQEPGTEKEIAEFCKGRFGVTFPMFAKVVVKGGDAVPVYKFLASAAGEPGWNFHKYLVDKDGKVIAGYESAVEPQAAELVKAVEAALAK